LVGDELQQESGFALNSFELTDKSGEQPRASASITMPDGTTRDGEATGDGAVDAVFHAINAATGIDVKLRDFRVDAVTAGQDALGEVHVMIERDGEAASGRAVATDIIEAAARAYMRALTLATRRLDAGDSTDERPSAVP
jgi:2-isopropylmalate synthase